PLLLEGQQQVGRPHPEVGKNVALAMRRLRRLAPGGVGVLQGDGTAEAGSAGVALGPARPGPAAPVGEDAGVWSRPGGGGAGAGRGAAGSSRTSGRWPATGGTGRSSGSS